MTAAVWQSGGRAVGLIMVLLTAGPPVRLIAQSEGSVLAGLSGSTRAAGLGGAGAALVGDAGAIFSNPAGIATIRHIAVEGSYERYLAGTTLSSAALAVRVGRFDWGVGAQALDYGSEPEVVPDNTTGGRTGIPTGATFAAADVLGISSLVFRTGLIAVGTSAKYARQMIGGYTADAWAGDVGMAYSTTDAQAAQNVLERYDVEFVYVGPLERGKYEAASLEKFRQFMDVAYENAEVTIYQRRGGATPSAAAPR